METITTRKIAGTNLYATYAGQGYERITDATGSVLGYVRRSIGCWESYRTRTDRTGNHPTKAAAAQSLTAA